MRVQPNQTSSKPSRVVIAGAGFAGLNAAQGLKNADVSVTLIDGNNYHCFQPLLYQVATATLSPAHIAWPIRNIFRDQKNLKVVMANITGIDTDKCNVLTDIRAFPYDTLILATGGTHSYFGHDEWAAFAPGLKTIDDAILIRRNILLAFEKAELVTGAEQEKLLTFVVIGGGPTGVELAGAIADMAQESLKSIYPQLPAEAATILLLEAGPRLLPSLPTDLSDYAAKSLMKKGVTVLTNTPVTDCHDGGVSTKNGFIPASVVLWAAGIAASPAAFWLGCAADKTGRIYVTPHLTVPNHPNVYAIGDTAAVTGNDGKPVPGVAPAAKQMGSYVAKAIRAKLKDIPVKPFKYHHQGDLATIGRGAAVVQVGRVHLKGNLGWLFWSIAHVYFLVGLRNRIAVTFQWIWQYLTLQHGAGLITKLERAETVPMQNFSRRKPDQGEKLDGTSRVKTEATAEGKRDWI